VLVDADTAATAVTTVLARLAATTKAGWSQRKGGAFAWVTGIDLPTLNGVVVEGSEGVDAATVDLFLDQLADTGLAHCMQARPPVTPWLAELAGERGLTVEEDLPLMVVENSLQPPPAPPVDALDGLQMRAVGPRDADTFAKIAAAGFDARLPALNDLVAMAFQLSGMRAYLGYIDDEAVGTAMGLTISDFVAIFTVSTVPGRRCRGVGTTLTAHAVRDGYAAGGTWSWLQSSSMGYGVYRNLGFVELERWASWVAGPGTP
jgi:hypothetical protein